MSAATLVSTSSVDCRYPVTIRFQRAKILEKSSSLGVFLLDEPNSLNNWITHYPATTYLDVKIERMTCRVFSFKEKMEDEKAALNYLKDCGYNPFIPSDAARLWRTEPLTQAHFIRKDDSREFYLENKDGSIHVKEQNFFIFHVHFLYNLKKSLNPRPSLIDAYKANNPSGLSACIDSTDPTKRYAVTQAKLERIRTQFFSNLIRFEELLDDKRHEDLVMICLDVEHPTTSITAAASSIPRKDRFIFKKTKHGFMLFVIQDDSPCWEGGYKTARFAFFIFDKVMPCIVHFCKKISEFEQEYLVRNHPLILEKSYTPWPIAFGAIKDEPAFMSSFACYGSLRLFLKKQKGLSEAIRNKLALTLLDAFIGTEFILHTDLSLDNILVHRTPDERFKCLLNDFGVSALKQKACPSSFQANQAKKITTFSTHPYLVSPEIIAMFYKKTRLMAINTYLKQAESEGRMVSKQELDSIEGQWTIKTDLTLDGSDDPTLKLTEKHWEKSTVFSAAQMIFNILFGVNLYRHLFDPTELNKNFPLYEKSISEIINDPLARLQIQERFLFKKDYDLAMSIYERAHTLLLTVKQQKTEELSKLTDKIEIEAASKNPFLCYPHKLNDVFKDPLTFSLLETKLKSFSEYETLLEIINKGYETMTKIRDSVYKGFLAKFICLKEIDISAAVPTTASEKLRKRVLILAQMLDKDPSTRITLTQAKEAFCKLDTEFPL